ncbi:MAG: hypothetical protein ACXADB_08880, partial [Candidatus Hermodarchaeia archaeon]
EETELFRLKHGNLSHAIRELIRTDVNLEILEEVSIDQSQLLEDPKPFQCDKNMPCRNCNQPDCPERVAEYQF